MIKTILFDFGDVFLDLDKKSPWKNFQELNPNAEVESLQPANFAYEKGSISSVEFFQHYQYQFPTLSYPNFQKIWNSMLIRLPEKRLGFLENLVLKHNYQLLLLSNTNALHIKWVQENIGQYSRFKKCFSGFYLSHEIGMRKPDPEIYHFVLEQHQLLPEEVLFIDDTPANTEAAKNIGLKVWNLNPEKDDITELFNKKKELF